MKGLFIPEITAEMFRNGCLESIEALMAEGEIYDIDYPSINDAHNEGYDVGYWAGRRDYEPKWIPVSERLPQKNGHYLCTVTKPQYMDRIYVRLNYWCGRWYGCETNEVVAWMPLPEPYKEQENGR